MFFSLCSSQLEDTYEALKEAHNQQLQVRVLGSSIKLSLLSRRTSKVRLPCLKSRTNRGKIERNATFDPFLTRAVHIQHVIASKQPIGIKRKRASKYSTAQELSIDTNYVRMAALVTKLCT